MKKIIVSVLVVLTLSIFLYNSLENNDEMLNKNENYAQKIELLNDKNDELESIIGEKEQIINRLNEKIDILNSYGKNETIDILESEEAKIALGGLEVMVIKSLKEKDLVKLSKYVHPATGVRFTPFSYIDTSKDVIFTNDALKIKDIFSKEKLWGHYSGSGLEILLTFEEYFEKMVYNLDYENAEEITYNNPQSTGNGIDNHLEVYGKSISVDYHFNGSEEYGKMDWNTLRLIFKKYEGKYYLVGIIHNEWTI